jgi:ubiquinone/menaquinone biosynthesis C-methylase UbiE
MELSSSTSEAERIREANIRYHDVAASSYDCKWGIDYGELGRDQVLMKLTKALGHEPGHYRRALEIGAGTGYFSLNLLRDGVIEHATATDISAGMLERLAQTAAEFALDVDTVKCDAEQLPFEDSSFDLVLGHAVLHHLPGLDRALAEFERVLVPGGTLVFMGEPSRYGDRIAALPKKLGHAAAPTWRRLVGAQLAANGSHEPESADHALERIVDVHTFTPAELRAMAAAAGFEDTRVSGEELLANVHGWLMRALEADATPASVPRAWHQFAFRTYLALQWMDSTLLEPRLPAELFYNLLLSARKPG